MISCSFCGKTSDEVYWLIAGPNVWICDECVILCVKMLIEKTTDNSDELRLLRQKDSARREKERLRKARYRAKRKEGR